MEEKSEQDSKQYAIFKITRKNKVNNIQIKISRIAADFFLESDKVEFIRVKK